MIDREPGQARTRPCHRLLLAAAACVMLCALAGAMVLTLPRSASGGHSAGRDAATAARLAATTPRKAIARVPSRFLASLPRSVRGRVAAALASRDKPGTTCTTIPGAAERGQAWIAGFANVRKLNGAALVGPAFAKVSIVVTEKICPTEVVETSTEVPSFRRKAEFPPMRATFLAFGFVPVTATVQISQVGLGRIDVDLVGAITVNTPYTVRAVAKLNVRVLNAKVNGVALPVGPHCQTVQPGTAILTNVNPTGQPGPKFWDATTGGPLSGSISLPHFANCGVGGDNLDPVLDASISGSGNFTKLIQGKPCIFKNVFGSTCPPVVPKPRR